MSNDYLHLIDNIYIIYTHVYARARANTFGLPVQRLVCQNATKIMHVVCKKWANPCWVCAHF